MAEPCESALSIERLVAEDDRDRLRGLSLEVRAGEVVALLGTRESGRTLLLETIAGFVTPSGGSVRVGGRGTTRLKPHVIAQLGVAYVAYAPDLFLDLTVIENLRLGVLASRKQTGRRERRGRIAWTLDRFPNLAEHAHRTTQDASPEIRRLLTIARALAGRPRLALIDGVDELSPDCLENVMVAIREAVHSGAAVLVATESIALAGRHTHRVYGLEGGRVAVEGASSTLDACVDLIAARLALRGVPARSNGSHHEASADMDDVTGREHPDP